MCIIKDCLNVMSKDPTNFNARNLRVPGVYGGLEANFCDWIDHDSDIT